jgi:hypothetical protein
VFLQEGIQLFVCLGKCRGVFQDKTEPLAFTDALDTTNQRLVYWVKHLDNPTSLFLEQTTRSSERTTWVVTNPAPMISVFRCVLAGCNEPMEQSQLIERFLICKPHMVSNYDVAGWLWNLVTRKQLMSKKNSAFF